VTNGPLKELLDFGGDTDQITLGLQLGGATAIHHIHGSTYVMQHLFNGNNFVISVALAEVCAPQSAVLVK